jgi:hypothetical protein
MRRAVCIHSFLPETALVVQQNLPPTVRCARLPDEVKNWIDLWLGQKGTRDTVLLALLDPPYEGASHSMETYLQEIARRGGMEFLVQSCDGAASRSPPR